LSRRSQLWLVIIVVTALLRVFSLSAYPLHDTTEARYAEVGRLMLASGDWITPQIEAGLPFWGKPPLSFWLTATSFELFGLNEFAARLPALLLLLAVAWLTYRFARKTLSVEAALGAAAILLTSAIGFVAAGAVMTDAPLLFGTTLSMVAFWKAVIERERQWRYVFFIGIAIGLLAKGPIALVLTAAPVGLWLLYEKNVSWSLRCLPWIPGLFVMLMVAAPWYVLAELKTPGFLEYFLVGEHWLRYVESSWAGDLYGTAHAEPRGTIWLFGIAAALPWSLVALIALLAAVRSWRTKLTLRTLTPLQTYLLLWTVVPLLVFTFAGNILPAYVLPGMPAFAILLGVWLTRQNRKFLHVAWLIPSIVVVGLSMASINAVSGKSQKNLIAHFASMATQGSISYYPSRPFSAEFYSRGSALEIRTESGLMKFLAEPGSDFIAIHRGALSALPGGMVSCLRLEAEFKRHLLFEKPATRCQDVADSGQNRRRTFQSAETG
jgi:4-amino-4-deoxy-L-arabinose transferase-like glycosyltransferase